MNRNMNNIGVIYATREGHTARIADRVAAGLIARGLPAEVRNVRESDSIPGLDQYRAVILAASVHAGKHEPEMVKFVKEHLTELQSLPAAFLSVTLSEAGVERPNATPEEHARFSADVQSVLDTFFKETGWHPRHVKPVAGALLYTKYNFLIRFIMKRIARKSGGDTDTSRDYEYTDWLALDRFVEELAGELLQ
jgi:menaquinone-dependent protoporphyrinogen oxidase